MGVALGAALASSALVSFTIFTALALGMASPYVVLCAFPPLLRIVPKPGEWMIGFKQFLGFLLAATVVWLVGVFGSLEAASGDRLGVHGVVILLAGLVLVSVSGWAYGRAQNPMSTPRRVTVGRAIAALALIAGIAWPWRLASAPPSKVLWQAWSPQLVQQLESEGTPYFIDFTAEWCLSCQANKVLALNKPAVAEAFDVREIVPIRADWTNKDAEIAKALQGYERAGVPLYVLSAGSGEVAILPNILTKGIVLRALDTAFSGVAGE
jgi:thiol:disulfide interchange protein DsbD